ncbi:zinc finger protein 271-like [Aricia agestis]|uniref:zinc finger protein 271-like n=1 Tax=Aricia agestis TaxID=91739 RepID=UPI001C207E19|nr:zinc finger protein 271-like [Aricia agestis]
MDCENTITSALEKNKNLSFFSKCRLCVENEGFAVISSLTNLCNNIYTHIGIMVQESDDLPNKICHTCYKIVVDFVELTSKASKNEVYLKSLFGDNNKKERKGENIVDSTSQIDEITEDLISCSESNVTKITVRKDLYESSPPSVKEENLDLKIKPVTHSEQTWECDICSKIFKTRKQHMLHLRCHKKNFPCPINICGKKFATKGDLDKHIRCHTGERPFQCDECKKSFTQRGSLKAHKISVHNMAT